MRTVIQALSLLLFSTLFFLATYKLPDWLPADIYLRLDPLLGMNAIFAAREIIGRALCGLPHGSLVTSHALLYFLHLSLGDYLDQSFLRLVASSVSRLGMDKFVIPSLFPICLLYVCNHPFHLWRDHSSQSSGSPLLVSVSLPVRGFS